MAEENTTQETEVSSNPSGPVISQEKTSTEVLDGNGKSLSADSPLSKIFDKVASGEEIKDAVKDVMKSTPPEKAKPLFAHKEEKVQEKVETTEEPEVKTDVVVENKKPDEKVTAPVDEVQDEELKVLPHDKPKTAQRISKLLKKISDAEQTITTTRKEAEEKAQRLAKLEEDLAKVQNVDPMADERVKQSLDELSMYRRKYDLERDPAIKEKYDNRISNAEETIYKSLTDRGLPESLLAEVKNEGGWIKFLDSERAIDLANGKKMTAAELAEAIKAQLPVTARREIESLELEQIQTKRDKDVYFQEESKKAKEYFDNQENMTKKQREEAKQNFDRANKVVSEWKTKFKEENEWLKEKAIDAKLNAEQKAELEAHNVHAKQLNSIIDKHLQAKDIDGMLEVLVDSIKYHQERRELANALDKTKKLEAQLKAKQEEIDRFKRADSPVQRGGSLRAAPTSSSESNKEVSQTRTLEDVFDSIAAGKGSE